MYRIDQNQKPPLKFDQFVFGFIIYFIDALSVQNQRHVLP